MKKPTLRHLIFLLAIIKVFPSAYSGTSFNTARIVMVNIIQENIKVFPLFILILLCIKQLFMLNLFFSCLPLG